MFFKDNQNDNGTDQNNLGLQAQHDIIFDVSAADFETRVMRASMENPVIVEFWAPWCGPCKQLMPVLEKCIGEFGGDILMAKVNMDDNPELAQALRIQSVPTVFAFFGGQPVDAFQGNLPESQVKQFLQKVTEAVRQAKPDALDIPEALKMAAEALANNDLQTAQGIYSHILQENPNEAAAFAGLVRVFVAAGQVEQAQAILEQAPDSIQKTSEYEQAKSAVELAAHKPEGSDSELAVKVEKDPNDHQARFDLALHQFSAGSKEDAIDSLLHIIQAKRDWNEGAAKEQLLKFFEALGHSDPLTISSRRKLSSILFS